MYEGPIIYETTLPNYYLIGTVVVLVLLVFLLLFYSLGNIFKKANKKFIYAFIPFYNLLILLEVCNLSKIYFILSLIPGLNIISLLVMNIKLSKVFNKSFSFSLGLIFLPLIYYPILAFSSSRYIGINNQKVEEIVLQDIIKENVEAKESTTVLKTDKSISVGTTPVNNVSSVSETGNLQADTSILNMNKPKVIEYVECPNCKNKVKKDAGVCFICGHKF